MKNCEACDLNWDEDEHDACPACEARSHQDEDFHRQLYEGEKRAGLVGWRSDDPAPPADPRTPEYWGL